MEDPNKYSHGAGILIADGGEPAGGEDPDGEGEGSEDEPTLKEVKESIDNATDRMEDIHETAKSNAETLEEYGETLEDHGEAISTLKEAVDLDGEGGGASASGAGAGESESPELPDGAATMDDVEEAIAEATDDLATPDDIEASQEKFLAKFGGLDPDELPEEEEERQDVIRKAVHEAGADTAGDADESAVAKSEVADRDKDTGEVLLSTEAVADLEA